MTNLYGVQEYYPKVPSSLEYFLQEKSTEYKATTDFKKDDKKKTLLEK